MWGGVVGAVAGAAVTLLMYVVLMVTWEPLDAIHWIIGAVLILAGLVTGIAWCGPKVTEADPARPNLDPLQSPAAPGQPAEGEGE